MASSNYTANLHLNDWAAGDRPKRADFVSDNQIIDSVLGGHIADNTAHMTAAEKSRLSEPYVLRLYAGNGEASRSIDIGFKPNFVIVYRRGVSPVRLDNGITEVNSAVAAYGFGGTTGLILSQSGFSVSQTAVNSDGVKVNLNENGVQYTAIIFK